MMIWQTRIWEGNACLYTVTIFLLKTTVTYDLLLGGLPLQKHKPNQVWNIPILLFRVGKILSQSDAPAFFGIKDTSHIWQM